MASLAIVPNSALKPTRLRRAAYLGRLPATHLRAHRTGHVAVHHPLAGFVAGVRSLCGAAPDGWVSFQSFFGRLRASTFGF